MRLYDDRRIHLVFAAHSNIYISLVMLQAMGNTILWLAECPTDMGYGWCSFLGVRESTHPYLTAMPMRPPASEAIRDAVVLGISHSFAFTSILLAHLSSSIPSKRTPQVISK